MQVIDKIGKIFFFKSDIEDDPLRGHTYNIKNTRLKTKQKTKHFITERFFLRSQSLEVWTFALFFSIRYNINII